MALQQRVVLLAFDALDPETVRAQAAAGRLPTFRAVLETSASCTVRNPIGLFVGSLWSSFFTALTPVRTGFHCWEEIVGGTYTWRLTTADIAGTPFWETLSEQGKRVAILDVPHTRAGTPVNGVQLSEWGCHDRHFGLRSFPAEWSEEIIDDVGIHPILSVDPFAEREWAPDDYVHRAAAHRTLDEERMLRDGLTTGVERKLRLSTGVLTREPWDLFISVFGESHAVGHQLWHLHDRRHPRFDAARRATVGDPVDDVYERLDQALADHLALIDDDTTLLVLLSHGMGAHNDGTHLLPEMLRRLDAAYKKTLHRSRRGRGLSRIWSGLPASLRHAFSPALAWVVRRALRFRPQGDARDGETEDERRHQAFFLSPNNFVIGGVRLNMAGRESEGIVQPGQPAADVCRRLEADFLGMVNVATGTPVVRRVERSDAHYDRASLDALPDLFLEWNQDHPIETVWSPRVGVIHGRYQHWRTGDHRPDGLLLARGPGISQATAPSSIDIIDLAPSIAARLGVCLDDIDGRPAAWLASATP